MRFLTPKEDIGSPDKTYKQQLHELRVRLGENHIILTKGFIDEMVERETPFTKEEYLALEHSCCLYAHNKGWKYCPECGHALYVGENNE